MQIKFKVRRQLRNPESESWLAQQIALIVVGTTEYCQQQRDGYKWGLHTSGNNWWMSGIEEDGTLTVAFRYGHEKMMNGLLELLKFRFGVDEE